MANPNILTATTALGTTTYLTPSVITPLVLLPNPAASGKVFKINSIVAANINGSASVATTVAVYTNGAVAQGSAPSGGSTFQVVSAVQVPANASLIVVDKTTQLYLQEGTSIIVTSGTASGISYVISYEDMT
jgi:hypothetical protein